MTYANLDALETDLKTLLAKPEGPSPPAKLLVWLAVAYEGWHERRVSQLLVADMDMHGKRDIGLAP